MANRLQCYNTLVQKWPLPLFVWLWLDLKLFQCLGIDACHSFHLTWYHMQGYLACQSNIFLDLVGKSATSCIHKCLQTSYKTFKKCYNKKLSLSAKMKFLSLNVMINLCANYTRLCGPLNTCLLHRHACFTGKFTTDNIHIHPGPTGLFSISSVVRPDIEIIGSFIVTWQCIVWKCHFPLFHGSVSSSM